MPTLVSVLYDYQPSEPDELELRAGDVLYVVEYLDDGWCQGHFPDKPSDIGLFPSNYVRKKEKDKIQSHLPPFHSNQPVVEKNASTNVKAIHDYTPQGKELGYMMLTEILEPDELELHVGDVLVITIEQDDGWCRGYLESNPNLIGLFPSNYVAPLTPENNNSPIPLVEEAEDPYFMRNRVEIKAESPLQQDTPNNSLVQEPQSESEAAQGSSSSDGYYDERGFYITFSGYYDTEGTFYPTSNDVAANVTTAAASGWYDESGNYIVEGGYYDTEGLFHTTPTIVNTNLSASPVEPLTTPNAEATEVVSLPKTPSAKELTKASSFNENKATIAALDEMVQNPGLNQDNGNKTNKNTVAQLKRELEKAKRASELAEQARLQAESDMQKELEARRRSLKKQLDEEQKAKNKQGQIELQIQLQLKNSLYIEAATKVQRRYRRGNFYRRMSYIIQLQRSAKVVQQATRHYFRRKRIIKLISLLRKAIIEQENKRTKNPKRLGRYHSKVHVTAASRIQQATRNHLACKDAKEELKMLRRQKERIIVSPQHTKARIIKPKRNDDANGKTLIYTSSSHQLYQGQVINPNQIDQSPESLVKSPSAVVVPLYTTDVAQISQLATLIANSVNLELGRRLTVHESHLKELASSMQKLNHAIEKHNIALQKLYDRPYPTNEVISQINVSSVVQNSPIPPRQTHIEKKPAIESSPVYKRPVNKSPPRSQIASLEVIDPQKLKPLPPSPKLVKPTGSPTKTRLPQLKNPKPRKSNDVDVLEAFACFSTDSSSKPLLSTVRDTLHDVFLDDDIDLLKYLVVLVLSEASDELMDQIASTSEPNNKPSSHFEVRLADGDAIPKCEATLLYAPVSKKEQEEAKRKQKKLIKKKIKKLKKSATEIGPEFYVASEEDLLEHFHLLPFATKQTDDGIQYIETNPPKDKFHRMLAVDCEMCKTTKGVELTRVSIVDENHEVLLDEYVLPMNKIVDYCTQYSGITQETLEDCENTLASIQKQVLEIVSSETILVGHSIENDLMALRLLHRRLIDTAIIYPHPKGPPFRSALRYLSATYLKQQIQTGSDGHCSIEDATCAMKLAQLKVKKGPMFPSCSMENQPRKLINELSKQKKSALIVDTPAACRSLAGSTAAAIPKTTITDVIAAIRHQLTTGCPPIFTWGRSTLPLESTAQDISKMSTEIYEDLPPASLLLVLVIPTITKLKELHKLRTTRADPRSTLLWDKTQQSKLDIVAARTQRGLLHLYSKPPKEDE
ncbi:exonuclease [Thraustotheca clavata]|uniref:Exonuclease n=1 Tax=Thraustotheca clavata TaxID=74557 RepID=A0A1V9ZJ32_9STRA|nr:exonuclease [Thraustotheca clavata]